MVPKYCVKFSQISNTEAVRRTFERRELGLRQSEFGCNGPQRLAGGAAERAQARAQFGCAIAICDFRASPELVAAELLVAVQRLANRRGIQSSVRSQPRYALQPRQLVGIVLPLPLLRTIRRYQALMFPQA